jgi:hypothetical protein
MRVLLNWASTLPNLKALSVADDEDHIPLMEWFHPDMNRPICHLDLGSRNYDTFEQLTMVNNKLKTLEFGRLTIKDWRPITTKLNENDESAGESDEGHTAKDGGNTQGSVVIHNSLSPFQDAVKDLLTGLADLREVSMSLRSGACSVYVDGKWVRPPPMNKEDLVCCYSCVSASRIDEMNRNLCFLYSLLHRKFVHYA